MKREEKSRILRDVDGTGQRHWRKVRRWAPKDKARERKKESQEPSNWELGGLRHAFSTKKKKKTR